MQLPRRNQFYPYSIGAGDAESASRPVPTNGKGASAALLKELQLYVEQEPTAKESLEGTTEQEMISKALGKQGESNSEAATVDDEALQDDTTQKDFDNALGHKFHRDPQVRRFQKRLKRSPEQCLRYCLWNNAATLWANSDSIPRTTASTPTESNDEAGGSSKEPTSEAQESIVPPCPNCGAPRAFELQVLPQLLYFMDVEGSGFLDFDWDTVVVFSCTKSCTALEHGADLVSDSTGTTGDLKASIEYAWVQAASK